VKERPDALAQIETVEDYVEARFAGAALDAEVRACVEALIAGGEGRRPVAASERQWQRRFKAEVGVSQRTLQAVLRFRRVFDAIEDPQTSGWVEAAIAVGYFDQPQMARDFRRFLGCTAREWAAQRAGLAKSLTTVGYKTERGE
jgi:AraC-like DNA-binding protein